MDDTLVSLNLNIFIAVLVRDESRLLAQIARTSLARACMAYGNAMLGLNRDDRPQADRRTNRAYFNDAIREQLGVPLDDPVVSDVFTYYEREVLPARNGTAIDAKPREGAHAAIEAVTARGLRLALFTNPSFSRDCIRCRMGWGELDDAPFEHITVMENSTRCKPSAAYYREGLAALGLSPAEVLMVGNDPRRDLCEPDIGLATAYVGRGTPGRALWCGSMRDFADRFDEIAERFEAAHHTDTAPCAAQRRRQAPSARRTPVGPT